MRARDYAILISCAVGMVACWIAGMLWVLK